MLDGLFWQYAHATKQRWLIEDIVGEIYPLAAIEMIGWAALAVTAYKFGKRFVFWFSVVPFLVSDALLVFTIFVNVGKHLTR